MGNPISIKATGGTTQNTVEVLGVQYSKPCTKDGQDIPGATTVMRQLYYKINGVQQAPVYIAEGDSLVIENAENKDSLITIGENSDLTTFLEVVIKGNKSKDVVKWGKNVQVNTTAIADASKQPKSNVKIDLGDGDDEVDIQEQTVAAAADGKTGVPNMGFLEILMGAGNDLIKTRSGLYALGIAANLGSSELNPGTDASKDVDHFYGDGLASTFLRVESNLASELRFLKLNVVTQMIKGASIVSTVDAQTSGVADLFTAMLAEMQRR